MKEQIVNIFNALLTISTKGEDTITMAKCLQGLQYYIMALPEEQPVMSQFTEEEQEEE